MKFPAPEYKPDDPFNNHRNGAQIQEKMKENIESEIWNSRFTNSLLAPITGTTIVNEFQKLSYCPVKCTVADEGLTRIQNSY